MANLNRDYLITLDVKTSKLDLSRNLEFFITDRRTMNVFVKLVISMTTNPLYKRYAELENASNFQVFMNILKPNKEMLSIEAYLHSEEEALFELDLPQEATNMVGEYKFEILTKSLVEGNEEIITSNQGTYKVNRSVFS